MQCLPTSAACRVNCRNGRVWKPVLRTLFTALNVRPSMMAKFVDTHAEHSRTDLFMWKKDSKQSSAFCTTAWLKLAFTCTQTLQTVYNCSSLWQTATTVKLVWEPRQLPSAHQKPLLVVQGPVGAEASCHWLVTATDRNFRQPQKVNQVFEVFSVTSNTAEVNCSMLWICCTLELERDSSYS